MLKNHPSHLSALASLREFFSSIPLRRFPSSTSAALSANSLSSAVHSFLLLRRFFFDVRRSTFAAVGSFLLAASLFADTAPGDAGWPENYPAWWYKAEDPARGFIDATQPELNVDNLAPLVIGQLQHIASEARDELDTVLAPVGGAGTDIDTLVDNFSASDPSRLAPAVISQLKYVSAKFFDRFAAVGFGPGDPGWPSALVLDAGEGDNAPTYPWLHNTSPDSLAPAAIAQAKFLYSWDLRSWVEEDSENNGTGDGLRDWWEQHHFGNLKQTGSSDFDLDGFSDLFEATERMNPTESYVWKNPVISKTDRGFEISNPNAYGLIAYSSDGAPIQFPEASAPGKQVSRTLAKGKTHNIKAQLFYNGYPVTPEVSLEVHLPADPVSRYMPSRKPLTGSVTIYYGRKSSNPRERLYATDPSVLDLGHVEVGYGVLASNSRYFNKDYSPDSRPVYYGLKYFSHGQYTIPDYVFSYDRSDLDDAVEAGRGWIKSYNDFQPDYSAESRTVFFGLKHFSEGRYSLPRYVCSYNRSDLDDAVEVGRGWINRYDQYETDTTASARTIYYGFKRFTHGSYGLNYEVYSYDRSDLDAATEIASGWITRYNRFQADTSATSRKIYYGSRRFVFGSYDFLRFIFSYRSSELLDSVEVGRGWIAGKYDYDADFSIPARKIHYGLKVFNDGGYGSPKYIFSHASSELDDAVEVSNGWITDYNRFQADEDRPAKAVYFGYEHFRHGRVSAYNHLYSHNQSSLDDAVEVGRGWVTGLHGFKTDYSASPQAVYSGSRKFLNKYDWQVYSYNTSRISGSLLKGNGWITSRSSWVDVSNTSDADGDGLIDRAENQLGTSRTRADTDLDQASDYDEVTKHQTDPLDWDSDSDLLPDGLEIAHDCLDPLIYNDPNAIDPVSGLPLYRAVQFGFDLCGGLADRDADGLDDLLEAKTYGTGVGRADTDGDTVKDGLEVTLGLNPLVPDTEHLDTDLNKDGIDDSVGLRLGIALDALNNDGDGLSNAEEVALGTDPTRRDTDGDGVEDGADAFPLDPDLSSLPRDSGDATAPVITLLAPPQATAL